MKKVSMKLFVMVMALCLLISGCSSGGNTKAPSPSAAPQASNPTTAPAAAKPAYEKPKFLSIGTAASGGAYYPIGIAMADIFTNNLGIQTTAQVTGGSIENNTLIQKKNVDLGITMTSSLYEAYTGTGPYKEKCEDLNLLLNNMSTGIFQVVVLENSGIKSMADLKGKKVVMGPAGGGGISVAQAIWSVYGFGLDDVKATYIAYTDGVAALKDGNADAVVIQSAPPAAAIKELTATTKGVKIISVEPDMVKKVIEKYPYLSSLTLSKDVYGISEDAVVLYAGTCLVVNKNLSEELVYDLTKQIFENLSKIQESHPSVKGTKLETAATGAPVPIHPGALKYYKEKGVIK